MLFGILLLVVLQPYKKHVSRQLQSNAIIYILYVMFYGVIMSIEVIDNVTQSYFVFVSLLGFIIAFVPLLGIFGCLRDSSTTDHSSGGIVWDMWALKMMELTQMLTVTGW
jgi:membrane-associated HD superfamily phosphohydrolase